MRPKANNRRKRRKNNLMTFTHPGQDSTRGQKYKFGARLWRKTIGPSALPHAPLSFFPIGYSEEFCFLWPIDDIFATAALFDFTVASLFGVRTRECTRLQIESCPSRFHVDVCFFVDIVRIFAWVVWERKCGKWPFDKYIFSNACVVLSRRASADGCVAPEIKWPFVVWR